jgi:hypothetical protein
MLLLLLLVMLAAVGARTADLDGSVVVNGNFVLVGYNGTVFELDGGGENCNGVRYFEGYSYCATQLKGGRLLRAKGVNFANMTSVVNASPLPNAHLVVLNRRYAFVSDVDESIWRVTLSTGRTLKLLGGLPNTRGMFLVDDDTLLSAGDHIARSTAVQSDSPTVETLLVLGADRFAYGVLQLEERIYWTENCGIWSCNASGGDVQLWKGFPCPRDPSVWSGPYFFLEHGGFFYWSRGIRYQTKGNFLERAPVGDASAVEALFISYKAEWFYDVFYLPPNWALGTA